jgi:hypothetical protein
MDDINDAFDIVSTRIERGEWNASDRAVYELLGRSAFRHISGSSYSQRDVDVVKTIQAAIARDVLAYENAPRSCGRCGERFGLLMTCENCDQAGSVSSHHPVATRSASRAGSPCTACCGSSSATGSPSSSSDRSGPHRQ